MKYIKDNQSKKNKLSKYLKKSNTEFKYYVCDEKYRKPRTKYIMDIIGDVELDEETYRLFMEQFDCSGGRYDVMTKRETIKGIYKISQKYPFLSVKALNEIWFVYIHDQFETYSLVEELEKYFILYGKTEQALDKYLNYIDETAKEFDKYFNEEAVKVRKLFDDYDKDFVKFLESLIKRQHISSETIIKCVPSIQLIDKDKKHLRKIIEETRIYFGACFPISYQMTKSLATGKSLDSYPEQPKYIINKTITIDTTFTKQEFLDSIKKRNKKAEQPKKLTKKL